MKKGRILLVFVAMLLVVSLAALPACKEEEPVKFTLKITAIGEGTTSPEPGTFTINVGESITVTAVPNTGYELDYWEGDVSGTTSPITFEMTSDMSVVAVFVEEVLAWAWPDKLVVASVGTASASHGAAIAWTTPLAKDTEMKVRVVAEENTSLRYRWLKQGIFFCAAAGQEAGSEMQEARGQWATRDGGPWQVRILSAITKRDMGFAVRADSRIKTPYDIKPGTKIIYMAFIPTGREVMEALLAWADISSDDVVWVPAGSLGANTTLLMDGRGDIAFSFPGNPVMYEAEAAPHGLSWIELDSEKDPEGAKRFHEVRPDLTLGVMTTGVPSAQGVHSISAMAPYTTSADTDPELVYHVVKWLDENYDKYKDAHPWCSFITIDNLMFLAETDCLPLHDGTVRYLEEIGRWTPAHEARRQQNIDLITRYVEAYRAAIDMADEKGIKIDLENEEWVELWNNCKKDLPRFKYFIGLD